MACINCLNFKYKKGWKLAYCIVGNLTDAKGKERVFRDKIGNKGEVTALINRAGKLEFLNKPCTLFVSMI